MGLGISGLLDSLAGILYTLFSLLAVCFYLLVREILYVVLTDGYKLKASQPGVKISATLAIGQFQKISVQYDGRLFGIPKARGGSLSWNSEGMEGYLRLEFRRHRGVSDLGFPEGTDK